MEFGTKVELLTRSPRPAPVICVLVWATRGEGRLGALRGDAVIIQCLMLLVQIGVVHGQLTQTRIQRKRNRLAIFLGISRYPQIRIQIWADDMCGGRGKDKSGNLRRNGLA